LSFERARALRRIKPQRIGSLARRPHAELPFVHADGPFSGPQLLLDTCVYIDVLQGNAPWFLRDLLNARICNHSAVCIAEMTHVFGRLDPAHSKTAPTLAKVRAVIESEIRPTRVATPDADDWGSAGILAGVLMRVGGYGRERRQACLNDALLFAQARKYGHTVLTRNRTEFDLLSQMLPDGRVLYYDAAGEQTS
jgi:predicted nucleic acid-binding protein